MHITSELAFAGAPARVAAMLADPDFATHLGEELHAENTTVSALDGGLAAVYSLPTPEVAARVLGRTMTLTQTTTLDPEARPDGTRTGRLTMTLAGIPAKADGPVTISPTEAGSAMRYEADFVVRIPLVGRRVEQLGVDNLQKAINTLQRVGNDWLTR